MNPTSYYYYASSNPCICTPSTPSDPDCPDECNCLKLCDITILRSSNEAVGPCAAKGTLNISSTSYGHDFCACGTDTQYWSVADFDKNIFYDVCINPTTGLLEWTTLGPEIFGLSNAGYSPVTLKLCCGELSAYMFVIIGLKDLCTCAGCGNCSGGEECNPCTGDCVAVTIDTAISSNNNPTDTQITS